MKSNHVQRVEQIGTLELQNISKQFSGHKANDQVNLVLKSGEIIGLLGENGAGKTTLMNILFGLYQPDSGRIVINGQEVVFRTPKDAIRMGIGMVHQHFMLVQNHTVAENIALGWDQSPFFAPIKKVAQQVALLSEQFGLKIDPWKKVWALAAGEQQRVEIVKTLIYGAEVLVMDEPTSVLTPQEVSELFIILRKMAEQGKSIILISHKLDEIQALCSKVVILRKGKNAGEALLKDTKKEDLARLMVGRDIVFTQRLSVKEPGPVILDLQSLNVDSDQGLPAVKDVKLQIHSGEILGIAGVSGNGQKELVEAITGLRALKSGKVFLEDQDITGVSARSAAGLGISHVPEERIKFGIVPNLLIYENSVLKSHHRKPFADLLFMDYSNIKDHAENIIEDFNVVAPSIKVPMKNLSGGNIQKLILGREILNNPKILVAAHPTYGLDIGAAEFIRSRLLQRREEGGAVLLVSEDLEELVNLCDRVAVMFRGRIMGIVDPRKVSLETIGLLMAGSRPDEEAV